MIYRDRDAPVTYDGLIFRTYGYDHPLDACFCDLEYAPETVYTTVEPRAVREGLPIKYFKFYFDGGLRFAMSRTSPYSLYHKSLDQVMVGVSDGQLSHVMRPEKRLVEFIESESDPLVNACMEVLDLVTESSTLKLRDFGVFGSIAFGFHNPVYSDIDLIIYGKRELQELRETLAILYEKGSLRNEFDNWSLQGSPAHWNFTRYTKEEYGRLQCRKGVYAIYTSESLGREVKIEFEPVKRWEEITNEYETTERILSLGRIEAVVEILDEEEGGFMPATWPVRLKEVEEGVGCEEVQRIVSYVEEFRLQVETGETALIRGNLERIETPGRDFHQITLSYGQDYFDQVLKPLGQAS
ncbi:MAG: nucleotidyltransferase domain-containing protein [Candidatus Bathyarchaeota archaeon]|nr:MAG: nucleotidyltransferase domain-containing protein [Candidatus Bathyarchaeota archaeon]